MSTNRRAAIYARFSTDLQNERSVEDQVALCRSLAEREGIEIIAVHSDAARSGASIIGRTGLIALINETGQHPCPFDMVLVEHPDRLSRDMADLANLHKDFAFRGIEIRAVNSGTMDTAMVGLFGLVGQMQREEGAKKTKRGLSGVVRSGRSAGGRLYGYRPVPGQPGELVIDEAEATIARRIFAEYLAGETPRAIAHRLNRDGIAAPRGARWNASTINGNSKRGYGLLQNELFAGKRVWNKVSMVRDPSTGKRVSRPNPPDQWQSADVPHLAIVDAETFAAANGRKIERARMAPAYQKKPRHLLSGLLRCHCGASMTSKGADKTGKNRVECSAHKESRSCPDPHVYYLEPIEAKVLGALREAIAEPEVLTEFVREYHAERERLAARHNRDRSRLERRKGELDREQKRVIDMMLATDGDVPDLVQRSKDIAAEQKSVMTQLEVLPDLTGVVALHPKAIDRYGQMLENLRAHLSRGNACGDPEAATALRDLIEYLSLHPGEDDGEVQIRIHGRMDRLLDSDEFPPSGGGLPISAVARACSVGLSGGATVADPRYQGL